MHKQDKKQLEKWQNARTLNDLDTMVDMTIRDYAPIGLKGVNYYLMGYPQPSELERMTNRMGSGIYNFTWERGWAMSCTLYVHTSLGNREYLTDDDGTLYSYTEYQVKVELSWSSTTRSVAEAQAAITLYQEVTNLAALLQARIDQEGPHVHLSEK